jgi:FkbM family methyltransferase
MPDDVLTFEIRYKKDGRRVPVVIHDTPLSKAVADDIFAGRAYPLVPFIKDVRTVLDIGANVGLAAIWFAMKYPGCRVVAAEPSSATFALLSENAKHWPGIEPYPVGLYDRAVQAPLFLGDPAGLTQSLSPNSATADRTITATLEDVETFIETHEIGAIDVLKLDTEGCERQILARIRPRIPGIRVIYIEYHSESDRRWIDELMAPTHLLHAGRVLHEHRGEFCYVARSAYPSAAEADRHEIHPAAL